MEHPVNIEEQATARVLKARAELIMARRFYGVLVSNVEPVLSRKFPTMATDGKRHFFNPEFIDGLTQEELLGVQCHESEHDARHHGSRRNGRDPVKWNEACDYAINIDLIDEGFTLPKGVLIDPQYRGMSAEDIYRCRELDAEKKRKEQEQQQQEQQQPDDGDDDDGDQSDDADDSEANDDDSEGDDAGDDADDAGDDSEGEGDDASDDEGDDSEAGSGGADGETSEAGDDGSAGGEGEGGEQEQQSCGDPGGCGEVLDSADDASDLAEEDIKWERVTRQAASMAKAVGQLPGHVSREIERANNPPREWRDELREFAEQGALRVETWNRPNRRFMHSRLVLPSTQRDGVNKGVFIIDTSGSCDDIALACVNAEATALLDDGVIDEIVVLYGDTRLTREDVYRTGDEMIFDPKGGGGTDMEPLFRHVAEAHDDASLIICFTDLEFYRSCGDEPHCPVLFAVHGYPQNVKRLMETAPWGARCIDVGAH
jgi:predicted metal-dependent peptidase